MVLSPKVSAVLITREREYPQDAFPHFPFDEVLVETQCAGVHRRFELAANARNEIVYVQDDDCTLNVAHLWGHYLAGANHGMEHLTNAITVGHQQIYNGTGVTLIGWGCFFPKRLIDFSRWVQRYGEMPPSHEYDRVFTYLAQPHRNVVMNITHFLRDRAMSRDNPDHYRSRDRIIAQLQAL